MNVTEINNAIAELSRVTASLEEILIENGGEFTEQAADKEAEIEAVKTLLNGEGIDSLGRWLKAKEDERETLKAEKASIDRRLKAVNNTVDYIKFLVGQVLRATGVDKAKGLLYGFSQAESTKNAVDVEALEEAYLKRAEDALRHALIPEYVHVSLKATTTELVAAGGDALRFIETMTKETSRFTKPRAAKEDRQQEGLQ